MSLFSHDTDDRWLLPCVLMSSMDRLCLQKTNQTKDNVVLWRKMFLFFFCLLSVFIFLFPYLLLLGGSKRDWNILFHLSFISILCTLVLMLFSVLLYFSLSVTWPDGVWLGRGDQEGRRHDFVWNMFWCPMFHCETEGHLAGAPVEPGTPNGWQPVPAPRQRYLSDEGQTAKLNGDNWTELDSRQGETAEEVSEEAEMEEEVWGEWIGGSEGGRWA